MSYESKMRFEEWRELLEKFKALSEVFAEEFILLHKSMLRKFHGKALPEILISIPLLFPTQKGNKFYARLSLYTPLKEERPIASISVMPKQTWSAFFLDFHREESNSQQWIVLPNTIEGCGGSYPLFIAGLKNLSKSQINTQQDTIIDDAVFSILRTAWCNLRDAMIKYFDNVNKKALWEERILWRSNRERTQLQTGLKEITRMCEESRSTIGPSKAFKAVRVCAESALETKREDTIIQVLSRLHSLFLAL